MAKMISHTYSYTWFSWEGRDGSMKGRGVLYDVCDLVSTYAPFEVASIYSLNNSSQREMFL